MNTRKTQVWRL